MKSGQNMHINELTYADMPALQRWRRPMKMTNNFLRKFGHSKKQSLSDNHTMQMFYMEDCLVCTKNNLHYMHRASMSFIQSSSKAQNINNNANSGNSNPERHNKRKEGRERKDRTDEAERDKSLSIEEKDELVVFVVALFRI